MFIRTNSGKSTLQCFILCRQYFSSKSVKDGPFNFVNGRKEQPVESTGCIDVLNPATGSVLVKMDGSGIREVDRVVLASKKAYDSWSMVL